MLQKFYDDFKLDKSKIPLTLSSCVAFKQKNSTQTLCLIRFMHRICEENMFNIIITKTLLAF